MTRSQRIALAMRGYKPVTVTIPAILLRRIPLRPDDYIIHAEVPNPHTFSVYVRGPKGLPCS